jgi:transposase
MEKQKKRFIGIDLGKRMMEVRILEDGKKAVAWSGKTDIKGRRNLIFRLEEGDQVFIEACQLAFIIAREIFKQINCNVFVLNPHKLHIIWKTIKKTDAEDALKLARLGMRIPPEELPTVPLPSEEEEILRAAVHELQFIKRQRIRYINRLHSIYVAAGLTTLTKKDLKTQKGRKNSIQQLSGRRLLEALRIQSLIDIHEIQIKEIDEEQGRLLLNNDSAKYLLSIPGVGPGFAAVFTAFIGNGERFSSPKQVSNYCGLVPRVDQSGDTVHYGHIIKRSCSEMRNVAVLAAWALTRSKYGGSLMKKYIKKASERGKMIAIVMLARRIVELSYLLVKMRMYYDNGELVEENPKLKMLKKKIAKKGGLVA